MSESQTEIPEVVNSVPKIFERDSRGLVVGVNYKFKPNGMIDYRAMVNPQWLVINRQYETQIQLKYGKAIYELKVEDVEDKYLLITLPGIKELASLRGIHSYIPYLEHVSDDKVACRAIITWIENFETQGRMVAFGGVANASKENTSGFGSMFLETIAENRAFVRCVRNFLGINVVGQDEIKQEKYAVSVNNEPVVAVNSAAAFLQKAADEKFPNFEKFKKWVNDNTSVDISQATSYASVETQKALELIPLIKNT